MDIYYFFAPFLSTPSARRATSSHHHQNMVVCPISIHALREEGDPQSSDNTRDRTISIHALREEGDLIVYDLHSLAGNFYPRPPRGGRLPRPLLLPKMSLFLSTPSARRATRTGPLLWQG